MNKSVQVMDEHLRHIVVSSYSLMLGESFGQAMKDVSSRNSSHYYQNLSLLQTSFDQLKLVEPLIDATYLSTPIGDFFTPLKISPTGRPTSWRNTGVIWSGRAGIPCGWGAHQSELFQSKGRVLSLLLKPTVIDNHNFPDVYMVVNMKEGAMRSILEQDLMNNQVQLFFAAKGWVDGHPAGDADLRFQYRAEFRQPVQCRGGRRFQLYQCQRRGAARQLQHAVDE
ncbi:hypothetical protein ACFSQ7_13065 [Paenibacillus rhizoplanae]